MNEKATIAEILHAKNAEKFARLVAQLLTMGLANPQLVAGESWAGCLSSR